MHVSIRRFPLPILISLCVLALVGCGSDSNNGNSSDVNPVVPDPVAQSGGLRDFFGSIESLTGTSLMVDGNMFIVDGDTHVFRQDVEIGYGALGVGDPVVVKARLNTRNELVAREIKVRVNNAPDIRVSGRVDQVLPPDLTVAGRLVHTNSGTQIFGVGDPRSLVDVHPGNQVTVTGPEGEDHSVLASKIRVEAKN
jgi:hypothetical protein